MECQHRHPLRRRMLIAAYQLIGETKSESLKEILDLFTRTALEICGGQQYDMEFESRTDVTEEEYIEMIRLKTAVLLACALKMGAIMGNAPKADTETLYQFGINIGLASSCRMTCWTFTETQPPSAKILEETYSATKRHSC